VKASLREMVDAAKLLIGHGEIEGTIAPVLGPPRHFLLSCVGCGHLSHTRWPRRVRLSKTWCALKGCYCPRSVPKWAFRLGLRATRKGKRR
jgi:hypothetical protein